ncbi:hypothetical protein AJ78_03292 [Emergomyces pasteurianus Ep9510]|uniref:SnoaL-like domain-containing protein n=1 Tax=Emergomyces pasteurianus Ep9510 TaxID=1447872 RepID=A0A1J9Q8K9_9EURO|nr:hypothetical protein AJ78_03292 [Emergomyces pasteurianus Ep9510]
MASSSKRLETAQKFIRNYDTLSTEPLESLLADNFVQQFAPASLNPPGPLNKKDMVEHIAGLHALMSGFPLTVKEYIESESSNQVTLWATSRAIFREEVKDSGISEAEWAFEGEYIFLLWVDEKSEKVVRVVEFLDGKRTETLLGLMQRARETIAKKNVT